MAVVGHLLCLSFYYNTKDFYYEQEIHSRVSNWIASRCRDCLHHLLGLIMKSTQLQKDRYAAKTLPELEAIARRYGFSKGWAHYVHNSRLKKQSTK